MNDVSHLFNRPGCHFMVNRVFESFEDDIALKILSEGLAPIPMNICPFPRLDRLVRSSRKERERRQVPRGHPRTQARRWQQLGKDDNDRYDGVTTRRDAFDGNPRDRARPATVHVKVAAAMPVRSERCRPPITLGSYHLRPLTFTTMQTARVGLGSALRSAQRMRTLFEP